MENWRPFVFYNNKKVERTKLSQNARQKCVRFTQKKPLSKTGAELKKSLNHLVRITEEVLSVKEDAFSWLKWSGREKDFKQRLLKNQRNEKWEVKK